MTLDSKTTDDFHRDGVVVLRQVFSSKWIRELCDGLAANMRSSGPYRREYSECKKSGSFCGDYCNRQRIAAYENFARRSPASELARALMGSIKVNFFHEHVIVKSPGVEEPTPWHHDYPYYCIDGMDSCSLWVPLDPVPQKNAVEFIAGSHLWGRLFQPKMFIGNDYPLGKDGFEIMPDIEAERKRHQILAFDLEPGDCAAFHFRAVHGAPGNCSSELWRRAIAFRWTGDDVTFQHRDGVMSPPFHEFDDCLLKPCDPLDSDLLPVIQPVCDA